MTDPLIPLGCLSSLYSGILMYFWCVPLRPVASPACRAHSSFDSLLARKAVHLSAFTSFLM